MNENDPALSPADDALINAIKNNDFEQVKQALNQGAHWNPQILDENGTFAMDLAIDFPQIQRALITHKADESKALKRAIKWGAGEIVEEFLQDPKYLSVLDKTIIDGTTPLDFAKLNGDYDMIAILRKHSQETQLVPYPELIPYPTKPDGSCAFHALLGVWSSNKKFYVCEEVFKFRKRLADTIREYQFNAVSKSDNERSIKNDIEQAIKNIIYDKNISMGENTRQAQIEYAEQDAQDIAKTHIAWRQLSKQIHEYPVILEMLEEFAQNSTGNKTLNLNTEEKLRHFLNENKNEEDMLTLRALITSLPEVEKLYQETSASGKKEYNWEKVLSNQAIINEYADFIEKPDTYIEPRELSIMAYLFNKQIHFYTTDAEKIVYNAASPEIVSICYTGGNHFERMANPSLTPFKLIFNEFHNTTTSNAMQGPKHEMSDF